jgi:hypothetical protein
LRLNLVDDLRLAIVPVLVGAGGAWSPATSLRGFTW